MFSAETGKSTNHRPNNHTRTTTAHAAQHDGDEAEARFAHRHMHPFPPHLHLLLYICGLRASTFDLIRIEAPLGIGR